MQSKKKTAKRSTEYLSFHFTGPGFTRNEPCLLKLRRPARRLPKPGPSAQGNKF